MLLEYFELLGHDNYLIYDKIVKKIEIYDISILEDNKFYRTRVVFYSFNDKIILDTNFQSNSKIPIYTNIGIFNHLCSEFFNQYKLI